MKLNEVVFVMRVGGLCGFHVGRVFACAKAVAMKKLAMDVAAPILTDESLSILHVL